MQIKNVLLAGCLISALSANDTAQNLGAFVFKNGSEQNTAQDLNLKEDKNIIYVKDISGVGESLEKAKSDAIQNAMRFGVGELLISKEELNNDELKQEVMNYSNAYVLDYKQTYEANEGGIYKVKADVTLEKSKVLGTLNRLNINVLDLSSGILKNYARDKAGKKDNVEKLIKSEIVEPFINGQAYDIEILDIQPMDRSDLIKARNERGINFKDDSIYKTFVLENKDLFVAKIKIKTNDDYVKKAEKIISQFSEQIGENMDRKKEINFTVDTRSYFIFENDIRVDIFNKYLNNIDVYGIVFRLIEDNGEIWIRKCVVNNHYMSYGSYDSSFRENQEHELVNNKLAYVFKLKKLKKPTKEDEKNNIEYYYGEYNDYAYGKMKDDEFNNPIGVYIFHQLPMLINPNKYKGKYLKFNTKEQIFYIVMRLDQKDIANTNKIELDLLYTKNNECNN